MKATLNIDSEEKYQAAVHLTNLLHWLGLKNGWSTRRAIIREYGEKWEQCDVCGEVLGDHIRDCEVEEYGGREYDDGDSFYDYE